MAIRLLQRQTITAAADAVAPRTGSIQIIAAIQITASAIRMILQRFRSASCEEILKEGLHYLAGQAKHLVIVSNDIFSDGVKYDPETEQYLKILGHLNQEVAAMADCVYEVVCGIPICIKRSVSV